MRSHPKVIFKTQNCLFSSQKYCALTNFEGPPFCVIRNSPLAPTLEVPHDHCNIDKCTYFSSALGCGPSCRTCFSGVSSFATLFPLSEKYVKIQGYEQFMLMLPNEFTIL